ncbi:penicillin acylase family protein [Actinophytocola sp.]|uniref:penicillin acylase family protein n=1 Tax=Actinophytocola sp. TaxID=1872138 RepID=UPI003D6BA49E
MVKAWPLRRIPRPFARLPRPLRWVARVVTGLLVIALVCTGIVAWQFQRSFPEVDGELAVDGLTGSVAVRRDDFGVPHIYADTPEDLFLAEGYVHAQDRFWEMDFRRHITAGRLSELFGEATLEQDKVTRTLGWRRVAERELTLLNPSTRRYLDAYAKGVNDWLADNPSGGTRSLEYVVLGLNNDDYEPQPWTPVDSLAWFKAMAWDLGANLYDELTGASAATRLPPARVAQLWPDYPYQRNAPIVGAGTLVDGRFDQNAVPTVQPAGYPGETPGTATDRAARAVTTLSGLVAGTGGTGIGSNSWVVSGRLTATGKPLLANDPHLMAGMPGTWYQVGLHCRDRDASCPFDVTGVSFSGLPGVIIGHNDRIAWGLTNFVADAMDVYLEKVDGDTYQRGAEKRPLDTRVEEIEVAGGKPVRLKVRSTDAGPIISDVYSDSEDALKGSSATAVALRWTALTPSRTADAVFALDAAQDWTQFRDALRLFSAPAQNMVYADADGNIGFQAVGTVPVRNAGDGTKPVAGWTGEQTWTGTVPFDELPHLFNPPEGFVVTANNAVIDPAQYGPLLSKAWAYGYRSERITDLIESAARTGPVTVDTMRRIQLDDRNTFAPALVPALLSVRVPEPVRQAQDILRRWDFGQGTDSAPAAYFNAVWRHLLSATFDDDLPEAARPDGTDRWFEVVRTLLTEPDDPFWDDTGTRKVERRDDIVRAALTAANTELTEQLGDDPSAWRWGDLHQLELVNPTLGTSGIGPVEWLFNRGPVPVAGGKDAVNATGWNPRKGYAVTTVPSMRMVVDLRDLDQSQWINLTGQSGHAFHRDYWDQTQLWAAGDMIAMRSGDSAVRSATTHTLTLNPA